MRYEGKLYGKVAGKYIELDTHAEIERLQKRIAELEAMITRLHNTNPHDIPRMHEWWHEMFKLMPMLSEGD